MFVGLVFFNIATQTVISSYHYYYFTIVSVTEMICICVCCQLDVDICVFLSTIKLSSILAAFTLDCKVALTEQDSIGKGKCYLKKHA